MQMRFDRNVKWLGAAIIAIVAGLASLPWVSSREANGTMEVLKGVAAHERAYDRLLDLLKDAETAQRGYVITGDKDFLDTYYASRTALPVALDGLTAMAESPEEQALMRDVGQLVAQKMDELAHTVRLRETAGFGPTAAIVADRRGKQYMDGLRRLIGDRLAVLAARRETLRARLTRDLERNTLLAILAALASTAIICASLFSALRNLRQRADAVLQARLLAENQAAQALQSQARSQRLAVTAQMLQAMDSLKVAGELAGVLPAFLPRLLSDTHGAVYLYRNSRDYLERCATWDANGAEAHVDHPDLVTPGQCWALRLGAPHLTGGPDALRCAHCAQCEGAAQARQLCVPMISQGEVIGLLVAGAGDEVQLDQGFVAAIAEQLALGISNINLREVLRRQSTVDELTGLYNRRYFDEACRHEMFRAERKQTPFALVMIDLDHFKRMNDTHGHDAGDLVLREAARQLHDAVRRSDIACRYGGEELVLLLPECDAPAAAKCADGIRRAIAGMDLSYRDAPLPVVTASFGVAAWPAHGDSLEAVLQAADAALYASKRAGRDRVTVA